MNCVLFPEIDKVFSLENILKNRKGNLSVRKSGNHTSAKLESKWLIDVAE